MRIIIIIFTNFYYTKKRDITCRSINKNLLFDEELISVLYCLLVMTLKKYIADNFGSLNGYTFPQLSDDQLDLKIKYSQEFLRVIGLVDPGLTKVRYNHGNYKAQQNTSYFLPIINVGG